MWQEYKEQHPAGYQYSWFSRTIENGLARLDVVMRYEHRAGEKLFVDYAGQTVDIIDRDSGKITRAQIFVAVIGAGNFTYAEGTASQKIEDWIGSHIQAFSYLGGVPEAVVPDKPGKRRQ